MALWVLLSKPAWFIVGYLAGALALGFYHYFWGLPYRKAGVKQ